MSIRKLNDNDKTLLKSKSAMSLPDNPSSKGLSASQILPKLYEPSLLLFDWVKIIGDELIDYEALKNLELATIDGRVTTLESYFSSGKAKQALADGDNNVISSTYAKLGSQNTFTEKNYFTERTWFKERAIIDNFTGDGILSLFYSYVETNAKTHFARVGLNENQYVYYQLPYDYSTTNSEKTYVLSTMSYVDSALDFAKDYTDTEVNKIKTGTYTSYKASRDGSGNIISQTYETKTDSLAKMERSNLVSILGNATQSIAGLMSDTDKTRLDVLYALLGTESDSDTVVNTINEVLAIFDQYPEGADLVNTLAGKVNTSDIVDNLTTQNANKPLSAKQGYALDNKIDTLESNFINAGFFEISNYDEGSGEITFIYSNSLYDLSYDTTTGVMTISAN